MSRTHNSETNQRIMAMLQEGLRPLEIRKRLPHVAGATISRFARRLGLPKFKAGHPLGAKGRCRQILSALQKSSRLKNKGWKCPEIHSTNQLTPDVMLRIMRRTMNLPTYRINVNEGLKFKRRRKAKGLEAKWVAAKMGISRSYLSDLELGRRRWNESLVARFEEAIA